MSEDARKSSTAALTRAIALLGLVLALASPAGAETRLFGTGEVASANMSAFRKWTGMLERVEARSAPSLPAALEAVRAEPAAAQIEAVNQAMNRHPYILDLVNWGIEDYWATPREFVAKDGDCEDYAIAKYFALRALGWPADSLRIVVVQDLNLRMPHAVLAVFHAGEAFILDNQIRAVMPSRQIHHYRPFYSINETGWWLHRSSPMLTTSTVATR